MIAEIGQPVTGSALWIAASLALLMVLAVAVIFWSEQRATRMIGRTLGELKDTAVPTPQSGTVDRF